MAERGDMTVLHEPFYNLKKFGATDAGGRTFNSCASLLGWLRDEAHGISVFLKDTTDHRHDDVFADRRFLAEARHGGVLRGRGAALHSARSRLGARRAARMATIGPLVADVSASTGFGPHDRAYSCTVGNSGELARLAAHHLPFYERLHAQRLDVTSWK
jgi:hypothetical protein